MPTTNPPLDFHCMPESLRLLAAKKGLHVEGDDITYAEDQGLTAKATLSLDRVLVWRDDAIRLRVRVFDRETADDEWMPLTEGDYSPPLTVEKAAELINHWGDLDLDAMSRERVTDEAFRSRMRGA